MTRGVLVGVLVIAIAGVLIPGFPKTAQAVAPGCDNRDLRGSYGLVGSSVTGNTIVTTSFGYLGVINFDGQGAFSASISLVDLPPTAFSGTYTVFTDCRGSISSGVGVFPAALAVVQGGNEVLFTTPFALGFALSVTGVMVKTARADPPGCDNRDLRGSYGLVGSGVAAPLPSLPPTIPPTITASFGYFGVIDFDGQGTYSAIITGSGTSFPGTMGGTYSVLPDCSGEVSIGFPFFHIVVVQGDEVLFATPAGSTAFLSVGTTGVMERIK